MTAQAATPRSATMIPSAAPPAPGTGGTSAPGTGVSEGSVAGAMDAGRSRAGSEGAGSANLGSPTADTHGAARKDAGSANRIPCRIRYPPAGCSPRPTFSASAPAPANPVHTVTGTQNGTRPAVPIPSRTSIIVFLAIFDPDTLFPARPHDWGRAARREDEQRQGKSAPLLHGSIHHLAASFNRRSASTCSGTSAISENAKRTVPVASSTKFAGMALIPNALLASRARS